MIYLDTSVLGAIFFREPGAIQVLDRIEAARKEGLMISAWTLTEMASAAAIKERTGVIDSAARQLALAAFQRFASGQLVLTEIDPGDFRTAATLLDAPGNLRSGDALHLAVARRMRTGLATLDQRQRLAATRNGITVLAFG